RDSACVWVALSPGDVSRRPPGRAAGAGVDLDGDVLSESDLAGAAGQVAAGEHSGDAAATAAGERAGVSGAGGEGDRDTLGARAVGAASAQSGLCGMPRHDRPVWVRAGELRRPGPLA